MEYYFGIGILNSKSNIRFPAVITGQLVWRVVESSLNMLSGKRKRWTEDINKTKTKSLPQRESPTLSSKIENTNLELGGPWHQLHKNSRGITSGRKKIGRKYPSETWKWRKRSKRRKVMILHQKKRITRHAKSSQCCLFKKLHFTILTDVLELGTLYEISINRRNKNKSIQAAVARKQNVQIRTFHLMKILCKKTTKQKKIITQHSKWN